MILEGTMTCYGGYFPAPRVTYRKSKQSYGVTSNARGEVEGRTVSAQKLLQESETERRELLGGTKENTVFRHKVT